MLEWDRKPASDQTRYLGGGMEQGGGTNEFKQRLVLPRPSDVACPPGLGSVDDAGLARVPDMPRPQSPPGGAGTSEPPTDRSPPPLPAGPDFGKELSYLMAGSAAQLLPPLIERYRGTEHEAALRAALEKHALRGWFRKKYSKSWTKSLRELLGE